MLLLRFALVCSLPALAAVAACQGKSTAPTPVADAKVADAKATKAAPASEVKAAETGPAHTGAADGGPSQAEIAAVEAANAGPTQEPTQGPVASLQGDPEKALGAHLVDPRWFRKTMFGDAATVLDTKRSQADEQGRFSSLIRFELPNMKPAGCADHLQALVKDDVPEVTRETKPDGRVQLSGSTDRYKLTFICGEAQGKTIAYVSYQWT